MNTLWIDIKYTNLLSNRLDLFKKKDNNLYNFRCPYCGDSQTKKTKARGYLFENKGNLVFKCHNCHVSTGMGAFIKHIDYSLFTEYKLEVMKEQGNTAPFVADIEKFSKQRIDKFDPFSKQKRISQLSFDHPAKTYVDKRRIPSDKHYLLYYVPKFCKWVNSFVENKFSEEALKRDEPRLVIPFIDQNGYVFGFQGRSFNSSNPKLRYITIMLDKTKPKLFGLNKIDFSKKVYCVEGPIDSLFIPNCLALAGADGEVEKLVDKNNLVMIYDNEPRNADIVKKIGNCIDNNISVVIWPDSIEQKDINDMILAGFSVEQIKDIIDNNTFNGLYAKMKFNDWKKL